MNLLLAGAENWILPGILLVLCVVLFVVYYFRNKKYQQNATVMQNNEQDEVEKRLLKLNDEEKELLIKKDKKKFLTINIILSITIGILVLIGLVMVIVQKAKSEKLVCGIFSIFIFVIGGAGCVISILQEKKMTDEKRIKRQLKITIRHEKAVQQRNERLFSDDNLDDNIVNVTLIDSYTEVTDKLHAIFNYQEIIQTRYYKFKVDYKDGHSNIVTEKEGTAKCINLMKLINRDPKVENKSQIDSTEEIRRYKKLLDDGIISQEEFEQKKKQLLKL